MQTKIKVFQTLSEALLPILGYYYWDWSFYDLLLFYFLDLLVATIFTFVKIKKIKEVKAQMTTLLGFISLMALCYVSIVLLALWIIPTIIPNFDFYKATVRFVLLQDMGLPQGVFLFPLVFYAGYLQYKMKFLQTNMAQKISVIEVKRQHVQGLLVIVAILGLSFALAQFVSISEQVAVFSLILLTALYSYFWRD